MVVLLVAHNIHGGSIAAFYNFKNENPSQQITALNQTKKEFTNTILNEVEPIDKSTGENIVASEPSTEISNTKNNSHNIEAKETQKEYTKRHSNENIKNHQANNNQAAPNSSSKKQILP